MFIFLYDCGGAVCPLITLLLQPPQGQQRPVWTRCGPRRHGSSRREGQEGDDLAGRGATPVVLGRAPAPCSPSAPWLPLSAPWLYQIWGGSENASLSSLKSEVRVCVRMKTQQLLPSQLSPIEQRLQTHSGWVGEGTCDNC